MVLPLQGRSHRFKSCSAHKGFSEINPKKIQIVNINTFVLILIKIIELEKKGTMSYKDWLYKLLSNLSPHFFNELEELILDKSNITIFDVGFYKGSFSKDLIKLLQKRKNISKYTVFSFEPNNNIDNTEFKNFADEHKVSWNHFINALGDENATKKFTILENFPPSGSSLNNILIDSYWLKTRKFIFSPFKNKQINLNISDVEVKKLDMFLTEITDLDILKIDVEGYSYEILQGGIEIIQKFKPLIQVEVLSKKENFSENVIKLTKLLKSIGYIEHSKKKHYTTHWFSDIICFDYLFIPEE